MTIPSAEAPELPQVLSFKPEVGQNRAFRALSTAKSFHLLRCLLSCPETTPIGWQDFKIQLLTYQRASVCLSDFSLPGFFFFIFARSLVRKGACDMNCEV